MGGSAMKESCLNCAHKDVCLARSIAIFQLFIVTGRDDMVPDAKKNLNIRLSCNHWKACGNTE